MQTPDQNEQINESLTEKIEELDSLISNDKAEQENIPVLNHMAGDDQTTSTDIPILDEVVSADEDSNKIQNQIDLPSTTTDQLMQLIGTIEHKLTDELETLVKTLKGSMRESIIDELKTRLEDSSNTPEEQTEQLTDLTQDQQNQDHFKL